MAQTGDPPGVGGPDPGTGSSPLHPPWWWRDGENGGTEEVILGRLWE